MAVGDIYQCTLRGSYLGQTTNNVFFYVSIIQDMPEVLVAEALFTELSAVVCGSGSTAMESALFSTQMQYIGWDIVNLFDEFGFGSFTFPTPTTGTTSGDGMPPFVAYEGFTQRVRRDIRAGRKRLAGVPELNQSNGIVTVGTLGGLNGALATSFGTGLQAFSGTANIEVEPCVVKRIKDTDPDTGRVTYRLPRNQAEAVIAPASVWTFSPALSTQSTRKVGRGN